MATDDHNTSKSVKNSAIKREVHPALVRGLACGGFGFMGGIFVASFVAPQSSDFVFSLFYIGGFLVGASIGVVLGIEQKERQDNSSRHE